MDQRDFVVVVFCFKKENALTLCDIAFVDQTWDYVGVFKIAGKEVRKNCGQEKGNSQIIVRPKHIRRYRRCEIAAKFFFVCSNQSI